MKKVYVGALALAICCFLAQPLFAGAGGEASGLGERQIQKLENPTLHLLFHGATGYEAYAEDFAEIYGGEIVRTVVGWEEVPSKLATMVMAGDPPDVMTPVAGFYVTILKSGLIQPLDDYIDFNDPRWEGMQKYLSMFMENGKHMATFSDVTTPGGIVWYNTRIFEENGLETPYELYKRNAWDWDALTELAIALTQDNDGDGVNDLYGFQEVNFNWKPLTEVPFVGVDAKGDYVNNMRNPRLYAGKDLLGDLYSKHKVIAPGNWLKNFLAGTTAMVEAPQWLYMRFNEMLGDGIVEVVPYPNLPGESKTYIWASLSSGMFMPKGAKNPDAAVALMTLVRDQVDVWAEIQENRLFASEKYNVTQQYWDVIDELGKNPRFEPVLDMADSFGMITIRRGGYPQDVWAGLPWSTLAEKYYPIMQADIEQKLSSD
jgi:multiple sugar transport system substrate-binding protein